MPALFILATTDTALAAAWERQLPAGRSALQLGAQALPGVAQPGLAAVVVLDVAAEAALPAGLAKNPTVLVGEPRSLPFEQARIAGRAQIYFSYEDSATRLGEYLPLLAELAENQSMVALLAEKNRRAEPSRPPFRPAANGADNADLWDFLEGAVEGMETRDRLVAEFRRASRQVLKASHTVFFLRDADGFRADRGTSFFPADDPLVAFFENHPSVVDAGGWDGPADPAAELAVRNRLALWGARLLVPVHDNGRLLGLVALGVRDDGQAYDEADRSRAVFFARLLRHCLARSAQITRLQHVAEQSGLGAKYLPGTLVLAPDEQPPRHAPVVVRDLIGQARSARQTCRATPDAHQPFRASAGIIAETGGAWAFWEEASSEVQDAAVRQRADRRALLRELALTLSHELGNSLVSLAALRHAGPVPSAGEPAPAVVPAPLLEAVRRDVAQLEKLNRHVGFMQSLHEAVPEQTDVRALAEQVGAAIGLRVEPVRESEPLLLMVSRAMVEFALKAIIESVAENRPELGMSELSLRIRATGQGAETTALFMLRGKQLQLEGIAPEPTEGAVPHHGRLGVFLAKEIIRLHRGSLLASAGMDGTEICLSLRSLA